MINWLLIEHAITIAKSRGYLEIDVEWIVPSSITDITRPKNRAGIKVKCEQHYPFGELIGSGESGLLYNRSSLEPDTRYVTTTPCFRTEDAFDFKQYLPYFMKTELMWANPKSPSQAMQHVIGTAKAIMRVYAPEIMEQTTEEGVDLFVNGIEVGSYGIRRYDGFCWVYGTAIAEPRFSYALRKQ